MKKLLATLAVTLTLISAGAFAMAVKPATPLLEERTHNNRTYLFAKTCPLPDMLIVGLHGGRGTSQGAADMMLFHERSECLAVAYPEHRPDVTTWNAHSYQGYRWRTNAEDAGVPDVLYLTSLINSLRTELGAPKVYLSGISKGAMMSYAVAYHAPGLVDAIGVVAGDFPDEHCQSPCLGPGNPVALKHIHGRRDSLVPLTWAQATIDRWRQANGCSASTVPASGGGKAYRHCSADTEYHYLFGVGHVWPEGATAALLEFFARQ